jgi:hypothetical protein
MNCKKIWKGGGLTMDNHTATEIAYKNGYEQGKKDAVKLCDEYCEGCIHSVVFGGIQGWPGMKRVQACEYILHAEERRPCPPGKGCTVKRTEQKGQEAP